MTETGTDQVPLLEQFYTVQLANLCAVPEAKRNVSLGPHTKQEPNSYVPASTNIHIVYVPRKSSKIRES